MADQISINTGTTSSQHTFSEDVIGDGENQQPSSNQASTTTAEHLGAQQTTEEKLLARQSLLDKLLSSVSEDQSETTGQEPVFEQINPLFHLVNAAKFNSQSSFDKLQQAINVLDHKAQNKSPFSEDEKEFLTQFYEALSAGGKAKGMPEAAALADHYINGNGQALEISAEPYKSSVIATETMEAMKSHIRDLANDNQSYATLDTTNSILRKSTHFKTLMKIGGSRDEFTQGYVKSDGIVHAEKNNQRLQKADNRFVIQAETTQLKNGDYKTTWRVENDYNFEPYLKSDKYTNLPLNPNMILKMPDGLSEYMDSGLGIAKPFDYHAEWTETWR